MPIGAIFGTCFGKYLIKKLRLKYPIIDQEMHIMRSISSVWFRHLFWCKSLIQAPFWLADFSMVFVLLFTVLGPQSIFKIWPRWTLSYSWSQFTAFGSLGLLCWVTSWELFFFKAASQTTLESCSACQELWHSFRWLWCTYLFPTALLSCSKSNNTSRVDKFSNKYIKRSS